MLDQSFSVDNFKKILDSENRKGVYLEGRFFPVIEEISKRIRACEDDTERREIIEEKKRELDKALNKVCKNIAAPNFKIELKKIAICGKDKPVYTIENTPECFFSTKQVQKNIYKLYKVKQANRDVIIGQLLNLLEDKLPKCVFKMDIKDFYESIPQERLFSKIHNENLLNPFSKKIIRNILDSYNRLSENDKKIGIPRGVGISAYLAELYMEGVDNCINNMEDLIYYARYVDDMVLIFSPTTTNCNKEFYSNKIKKFIGEEYSLCLNDDKREGIDLLDKAASREHTIKYLGYKITFGTGEVSTELTGKKFNRYKNRIDKAFKHYVDFKKYNEKKVRKLLEQRIRFLTGNTRLTNNKKNILVGIYFSNKLLTERGNINKLDIHLKKQINIYIKSTRLQKKLKKYRFLDGFEKRRFSPFKSNELKDIVKIWK